MNKYNLHFNRLVHVGLEGTLKNCSLIPSIILKFSLKNKQKKPAEGPALLGLVLTEKRSHWNFLKVVVNDNVAVERRGCAVVCMLGDEIPLRAFSDQARK